MKRVGWLADNPGYIGGAEMTQAELWGAAPKRVEVVPCPTGAVQPDLDVYVVHNCVSYTIEDVVAMGQQRVVKYVHDLWPHGDQGVRDELLAGAGDVIFTSPLHAERFPYEIDEEQVSIIPPPLDPKRYWRNDDAEGTCSIAAWQNPGKGQGILESWAAGNTAVDVYGTGTLPDGPNINQRGPLMPAEVAATLARYERFVFLPMALEPFGRCVAEAQLAGLRVVSNDLVGARYYADKPQELKRAATAFWKIVAP